MILPATPDRGIVVFKLLPSLDYNTRLFTSFTLIVSGLALQAASESLVSGLILIVAGNLLLLVNGYDNRVDFGRYRPEAEWQRVGIVKLKEIVRLHQKMRRWDRSALDVTNALGATLFVLLALVLGLSALVSGGMLRLLTVDAMVLLLPHWVTGVRRVLTRPKLLTKVETLRHVLRVAEARLRRHEVHVMMLLEGEGARLASDVKLKIDIDGRHPDFLGLYAQVVLNEVQGSSYPYFYVVLVARRGFGLKKAFAAFEPPRRVTKEMKREGEVEVLVIRQRTTRTSGYHTKRRKAVEIFDKGLSLAERVARGG